MGTVNLKYFFSSTQIKLSKRKKVQSQPQGARVSQMPIGCLKEPYVFKPQSASIDTQLNFSVLHNKTNFWAPKDFYRAKLAKLS